MGDNLTKTGVLTSAVPFDLGMVEAACGIISFPNYFHKANDILKSRNSIQVTKQQCLYIMEKR